jgi:chorismate dehydratase
MAQKSRVKVGAVSFLNTKPLIYPFLDDSQFPGSEAIELSLAVPSRLAIELKDGDLDVGLIPIIEYFRADIEYRIIRGISICSRGPVLSIQLLSRVPIPAIRSVALDTSSRSSRALVQILLAEEYNLDPEFHSCPPTIDPQEAETDAMLLIGDAALRRLGATDYALDLGAKWKTLTGLPFVYACWVARGEIELGQVPQTLLNAKEDGIKKISEIVRIESPKLGFPETLCRDYLTKHICYELSESEIAGLKKFYEFAVKYDLAQPDVKLRFV